MDAAPSPREGEPLAPNVDGPAPFTLAAGPGWGLRRTLARLMSPLVERLLGLGGLNRIYWKSLTMPGGRSFAAQVLDACDTTLEIPEGERERIPPEGPVVVVANHPFGGIEGLALIALLHESRPDMRVMANFLLLRIPELRPWIIPVDPFGGTRSAQRNIAPLRQSLGWLKKGGALGVFPSGEVAHFQPRHRAIREVPWSPTIARLVRASRATVVPIYFAGRNGMLFHLLGLLHRRLRTALLPRQLLNKRGTTLRIRVGNPIPPEAWEAYQGDQELIQYLRVRTYLLASGVPGRKERARRPARRPALPPVHPPLPPAGLEREVAALPPESLLVGGEGLRVYHARASQIPLLLEEIGRLREVSFRGVGEGSGKPLDLDRFDEHYRHLFIWNTEASEVVGAYRLGLTDEIVPREGIAGLYTSTLFRYGPRLLEQVTPAIELGRSFIRPEWQRNYSSLMLLWKGIACFVCRNPKYRNLFGPVSISNDYHDLSRLLLVRFLEASRLAPDLARLCRARNPLRRGRRPAAQELCAFPARDLEQVEELIAEIERRPRGMPVLLRQYLKLGARLLGFNVDPDFENCLDGLVYVDLTRTPWPVLVRYMGRREAEGFLAAHGAVPAAAR